jgi:hypothetical protein
MSPDVKNMKTGLEEIEGKEEIESALGTAENVTRSAKDESETRHPPHRQKTCPGSQNMKTGPDALGTAENESGHAKHKNESRRRWYRRNRVHERKI